MTLNIEVVPMESERPSLKAFKAYICARYRVKNVNDLPMSTSEYGNLMSIFEAGWGAREQEFVNTMLEKKSLPSESAGNPTLEG